MVRGASVKEIEFNEKKFQELVLYVAQRSQRDPRFGATKLNKLLFYMDFGSYRLLGTSITGATYCHLPAGPAPRELMSARKYLLDSGDASCEYRPRFTGTQERLVPQRGADLSLFSRQELAIIEDVITEFWALNARSISDYSHQEWAWRATQDYEDMPYHLAWVSSDPLTPEQVETGRELATNLGLLAS